MERICVMCGSKEGTQVKPNEYDWYWLPPAPRFGPFCTQQCMVDWNSRAPEKVLADTFPDAQHGEYLVFLATQSPPEQEAAFDIAWGSPTVTPENTLVLKERHHVSTGADGSRVSANA